MLQPAPTQTAPIPHPTTSTKPVWSASVPVEQGTIGPTILLKGEVTGSEPLYIDGCVEGTIHFAEHRVTIGRHGKVTANIDAREVVVMGSVTGNIRCTGRVEIRAEGSLIGDVVTARISVEDGATLKGNVDVQAAESHAELKAEATWHGTQIMPVESATFLEKAKSTAAGAGT